MRSYIIGDGGDFKDFNEKLSKLTINEREKLKNEYSEKYHGSLDNEFLSKVDKAHQLEYSHLLSADKQDGVQSFIDRTKIADAQGDTVDSSQETLARAVQLNQSLLTEYSNMREKLPEDKQKILDQYFSEAKFQAVKSEEAKAELIYNATMAAAMLATIPMTAGLSAAAMAAIIPAAAAAGAGSRIALMAAVQGGDFDDSTRNIVKQAIIGGIDGLLMAAPGAVLGTGAKGAAELSQSTKGEIAAFLKQVKESGAVVSPELSAAGVDAEKLEAQRLAQSAAQARLEQQVVKQLPPPTVVAEVAPTAVESAAPTVVEHAAPTVVEQVAPKIVEQTPVNTLTAAEQANFERIGEFLRSEHEIVPTAIKEIKEPLPGVIAAAREAGQVVPEVIAATPVKALTEAEQANFNRIGEFLRSEHEVLPTPIKEIKEPLPSVTAARSWTSGA